MAPHGRHRYALLRTRSHGARPEGMRQIIRTPTFALGLGVVAAAVLAFGTTQTYLRFSGSGPSEGCGVTGCANPAASPAPHTSRQNASPVQITYKTVDTWTTGFTGQLTISNRTKHEITAWHLAIAYKGAHITQLSGAEWIPHPNRASATIEPADTNDRLAAGKTVRIIYTATGNAHPPSGCTFDGARCRIRSTPVP